MKRDDFLKYLEEKWPLSYAMDWDNVGLLLGNRQGEIKKVLVALDVTDSVVEAAIKEEVDCLISHHPLIFSSLKKITEDDFIGRRILKLLRYDISYFAMHTNFDAVQMWKINKESLGLDKTEILQVTGEDKNGESLGIGCFGSIEEMSLKDFAHRVKKNLQIADVKVFGDLEKRVSLVGISGGSGKSAIRPALDKQLDVLVTGDIDHHSGIDALAQGLCIIDAGHYGTEHKFVDYVKNNLEKAFSDLEIIGEKEANPFITI